MEVRRLSSDSASCDPLVVREGETVRLVFKPTLVKNLQDENNPVRGEFVYQKKKRADEWEDDVSAKINDIEAGSGLKLALGPTEINKVVDYVTALNGFYRQYGIPASRGEVVLSGTAPALTGNATKLVNQLVGESGIEALSVLLKWATETEKSEEVVQQLMRLDVDSIRHINTLVGIGTLKKLLNDWQTEKRNSSEDYWQNLLSAHPFVLSQVFSAPLIYLGEKFYVGGKHVEGRGGKHPDIFMKTARTGNALIVELKEPMTQLLGKNYRPPDVYAPSAAISGAIVQTSHYRDRLLKHYHSLASESDTKFEALSPQSLVIAGNTDEFQGDRAKITSFELFRNNLKDCILITYDELFEKTQYLVELLEEGTKDEPPF